MLSFTPDVGYLLQSNSRSIYKITLNNDITACEGHVVPYSRPQQMEHSSSSTSLMIQLSAAQGRASSQQPIWQYHTWMTHGPSNY